jgi:2-iminobutanoate/2-iminopropanoate deaminase
MFASERKIVCTTDAHKAIGPYAQAVRYGDLLFVSGMIAIDPQTGELVVGSFEDEVTRVLENIKAVVEADGMTFGNVLKATVFLKDLGQFEVFNEIYGRYFGEILPARETVQAAQLPRGVSIEISVICGK